MLGGDISDYDIGSYIQQVIWAKKYLPRKNKGFRQPILNSRIFIEYHYQLESLTMSLKKVGKPQNALFIRFSPINANSQKTPAECRLDGSITGV
jgi:hypothetical protein